MDGVVVRRTLSIPLVALSTPDWGSQNIVEAVRLTSEACAVALCVVLVARNKDDAMSVENRIVFLVGCPVLPVLVLVVQVWSVTNYLRLKKIVQLLGRGKKIAGNIIWNEEEIIKRWIDWRFQTSFNYCRKYSSRVSFSNDSRFKKSRYCHSFFVVILFFRTLCSIHWTLRTFSLTNSYFLI